MITINNFYIIGISIETTNAGGQSAKDLEKLWGNFWSENIPNRIPTKISDDIYAVYTDYETDHTGKYTTIIGLPVSSLTEIPEGFVGREIQGGNFEQFTSKGKMPEAVVKTWMDIWQDKQLKRAYHADFDVLGKKYYDGENAEVETYISIIEE